MSNSIPSNSNFKGIGCQLGGLTLNGNVANGTAQSVTFVTINDPTVIQNPGPITPGTVVGYLKVVIGNPNTPSVVGIDFTKPFFIPLFQ